MDTWKNDWIIHGRIEIYFHIFIILQSRWVWTSSVCPDGKVIIITLGLFSLIWHYVQNGITIVSLRNQSYCQCLGIHRRLSIKSISSATVKRNNAKFRAKVHQPRYIQTTFLIFVSFDFKLCFVLLHSRATVMTRASVVRPSVRRHRFLGNRQVDWHQILLTGTYPPHLQTIFFLLFKILKFWFFHEFFRFITIGPYGSKYFKRHLLWRYAPDSLPKIMYTPGESPYQSCSKNCEISNFGYFFFCSSLGRLTW